MAAAVGLVAAGVGVWQLYGPGRSGPAPQAQRASGSGRMASSNTPTTADPGSSKSSAGSAEALPTREDGRFSNAIRLSTRIEKTYYPYGIWTCDDEQAFVLHVVDGKLSAVPADQQAPNLSETTRAMNNFSGVAGRLDRNVHAPVISPDGHRVAHVRPLGESRQAAVVDGNEGPEYQAIFGLTFSPDGQRTAYIARVTSERMVVVVDGKEQKPYPYIPLPVPGSFPSQQTRDGVQFSPDSKHVAYIALPERNKAEQVLVVDGEERPLDTRAAFDLTWSPDSRRIACVVIEPWKDSLYGQVPGAVYVDGTKGKTYGQMIRGSLRFSADGARIAYIAGTGLKGPVFAVENGEQGKPYTFIFPLSVQYNPRGQLEYDAIAGGEPTDVSRIPMLPEEVRTSGKRVHVCAGAETEGFRHQLCYSADGNHSAWAVMRESKYVVIHDGHPSDKGYQSVTCLRLSPDGRHCAFVGDSSKLVIDGMEMPFQLNGVIEKLRYVATDTLRMALRSENTFQAENNWRVVEVKIRPAPPAVPPMALDVVKGSDKSEQRVAMLRKIAAADHSQQFNLLQSIPLAYAVAGEKQAALAAFEACEAQLAAGLQPIVTFAGPNTTMTLAPPDPAKRDLRRSNMIALLVPALLGKGEKAAAAQLATELAAEAARFETIQAQENWDMQRDVAAALGAVGDLAGLEKFMQAVQTNPKLRSDLACKFASYQALSGDGAGAATVAATVADLQARADAFETIGMLLERRGDRAGAADAYGNALLANLKQGTIGGPIYTAIARTGGVAALRRFHETVPADLRKQRGSIVHAAFMTIRSECQAATALDSLGLLEAGDGGLPQLADSCWQATRYFDGDVAWRKGLRSAAVRLGALDPEDCAPMNLFYFIASSQRSERDTAALAETVAQAARAYRGKCRSADQREFGKVWLLAEMQLWAGDKAGAAQTLKDVPPTVSPTELPTLAQLQAQAGDSVGAAETVRKIEQWIGTLNDESARDVARVRLANAQIAAGNLKEAAETLARCSPTVSATSEADVPQLAYARLAAAHFLKGDKAAGEEAGAKAAALAEADARRKLDSVWGAIAGALADAGDTKTALDMLNREKDRLIRMKDLSAVARALIAIGDIDGAAKVLLRTDRGSEIGSISTVQSLAMELAMTGNYKGAIQLITRSAPQQDNPMQNRQPQAGWAVLAAVRAGDLDAALSAMPFWTPELLTKMAQIRLDARDEAGAKRILEWGRDKPGFAGYSTAPEQMLQLVADLMRDAGFEVEAEETMTLALEKASRNGGATRPSQPGEPALRRSTNPFSREFESPKDAPLVRQMVRAGELDEVLYWAKLLPGNRRYAICAEAMQAVLDRPELPRRSMVAEPRPRLQRRTMQ